MEEQRYNVLCILRGQTDIVAENMSLDDACLLVTAFFTKFYKETDMKLQIQPRVKSE